MSFCRAIHPPVTSSATMFRCASKPYSRQTLQTIRSFSSYGNASGSSRRDMQTATAYHPHSLPSSIPPPRNTGVPDTSIAADYPPSLRNTEQQKTQSIEMPPDVSLKESEAQKSMPTEASKKPAETSKKPGEKPRRKLRPRKAAMKVSPTAIEQLRKLVAQPDPKFIRVGVKNKGCSGLAYHLEYVEKQGTFDEVVEQDGIKVLIDSKALFSIIGSEMDWQEDKLSKRFVFTNPNISKLFYNVRCVRNTVANSMYRGIMWVRRIFHGLVDIHPTFCFF